jgi:hypothetical protein
MRHTPKPFIVQSRKRRRVASAAQPLFSELQLQEAQEPIVADVRRLTDREQSAFKPAGEIRQPLPAPRILPDLTVSEPPIATRERSEPRIVRAEAAASVAVAESEPSPLPPRQKKPARIVVAPRPRVRAEPKVVIAQAPEPAAAAGDDTEETATTSRRTRRLQHAASALRPGERWKRRLPRTLW